MLPLFGTFYAVVFYAEGFLDSVVEKPCIGRSIVSIMDQPPLSLTHTHTAPSLSLYDIVKLKR
jgi:hypothetical protein